MFAISIEIIHTFNLPIVATPPWVIKRKRINQEADSKFL